MVHRTSGLIMCNPSTHNSLGLIRTKTIIQCMQKICLVFWVNMGRLRACCGAHYLLGTPETSRRGRSTRKARRALTSNPPGLPPCPCIDGWLLSPSPSTFSSLVKSSKTTLKSLSENKERSPHYYSAKENIL